MTGTRNPSRKYFTRNQPYFYKSADNWEEWDTDEKYDRTFFIGVDDTNPEDIDVALYMIWGGKPVAVVGDKVLDTISGTVELAEQLETEIQSILEEVQELAAAVAQSEIDIEEAVATMNELVDRCEGILEGAEAARDSAKDWATKMDGQVEEEGEPIDYSAKYYANEAGDSATAAAGSASSASDDADLAEAWATKTDGTVDGSEYSSKYYAGQSADSATTAAGKAGEASASAALASKWATQLTTPVEGGEYSAKKYAQDAGTSATNAGTSETNAGISAGAASGSATAAANSATLAQDWAVKMDGQVASTDYSSKYYAGQAATSANNSQIWAEGTDVQVQALGGVHSSKVWAEQSTNANVNLSNLSAAGEAKIAGAVPTGTILPYGGSTAPTGWLLCNGGAISRTTYADLFAIIGTNYGAGDGSTTFNLPNLSNLYLLNGLSVNTPSQYCRGTGLTMGFLTGVPSAPRIGMRAGDGGYSGAMVGSTGIYGTAIGTAPSGTSVATGWSVGLTTDATYSGVMRDAVTSSVSNYQTAKAIIKY